MSEFVTKLGAIAIWVAVYYASRAEIEKEDQRKRKSS